MPVGVVLNFPGGTAAQYDQVAMDLMKFSPGGQGAPGLLFHWVTITDDGTRVTDVWRTREQFDRFAAEQIGPYTQQVGLSEPEITFYDVHNYLTAG
jgi:hypothetical protein